MGKQLPYQAFAILYRTNAQSRAMEEALRRMNIPYRIYGGVSFYQRREIKDVLAYFRLIINPMDEDALLRIINFPARGIGQTTVNKLLAIANDKNKPLWDVVCDPMAFKTGLHAGILGRLEQFSTLIKGFSALLFRVNAFELGEKVINQSGIRKFYFEDGTPESVNRRENIEELLTGLKDFVVANTDESDSQHMPTLDEFMQDIALLTDTDIQDNQQKTKKTDPNKVSLMTIHAAKGLEFPYVFITGVEENLFPSLLSIGSRQELEEERRLFYVALTRAMQQATITYAETRFRYGNFSFCEPSRFIDELDQQHTLMMTGTTSRKPKPQAEESFRESLRNFRKLEADPLFNDKPGQSNTPANQSAGAEPDSTGYSILSPDMIKQDTMVQHQRFGTGKVTAIEGNGQNTKATVIFSNFGKKQLLLKFARLKILNG
jgi:DNA helicase-2/ATP-dependent DNA helicase PcrA